MLQICIWELLFSHQTSYLRPPMATACGTESALVIIDIFKKIFYFYLLSSSLQALLAR